MKKSPKENSIFWFRRDLRLKDNKALFEACDQSKCVIPIFIFDEHILKKLKNKKDKRVWFIWESLQALKTKLNKKNLDLLIFKGRPEEILPKLIQELQIGSIYCNEDYEPYAINRDKKIKQISQKNDCNFYAVKDQVIFRGNEILKKDLSAYKVFTPYKNAWLEKIKPLDLTSFNANLNKLIKVDTKKLPIIENFQEISFLQPENSLIAGEEQAQKLFKEFLNQIDQYHKERDFIDLDSNSKLSPYIRFGLISIRELLRKTYLLETKGSNTWVSELIWREFYQMILYQNPNVIKEEYIPKYRNINWLGDSSNFHKWVLGETGFPIIDAAMRLFAKTGTMHNRLRMIVASFLVKDLLIDWRKGEEYFSQTLLDFDLASNNGGWQWCASTGCDAQPYFRIFNPVLQSKKFDPKGIFIKKQIPALRHFPEKYIHTPEKAPLEVQQKEKKK